MTKSPQEDGKGASGDPTEWVAPTVKNYPYYYKDHPRGLTTTPRATWLHQLTERPHRQADLQGYRHVSGSWMSRHPPQTKPPGALPNNCPRECNHQNTQPNTLQVCPKMPRCTLRGWGVGPPGLPKMVKFGQNRESLNVRCGTAA